MKLGLVTGEDGERGTLLHHGLFLVTISILLVTTVTLSIFMVNSVVNNNSNSGSGGSSGGLDRGRSAMPRGRGSPRCMVLKSFGTSTGCDHLVLIGIRGPLPRSFSCANGLVAFPIDCGVNSARCLRVSGSV